MAKKPAVSAQSVAPSENMFTNRVLQSVIETVNNLIANKVPFGANNGHKIVTLATACQNAFAPAARLLEEYSKDAQERIKVIVEPFGEDSAALEADASAKKAIEALNSEYVAKVNELMAIEVPVDYKPITMDVFRTSDGKQVDLDLGTIVTFNNFIKG